MFNLSEPNYLPWKGLTRRGLGYEKILAILRIAWVYYRGGL